MCRLLSVVEGILFGIHVPVQNQVGFLALGFSLQLWMRDMAPNKAAGKLAKAMAAKTKAVKKETKTPDRRRRGKGPAEAALAKEPASSASASPAEDHDFLGYPRGTVSSLLTSLKYQLVAKKNSSQQKADASEVLKEICLCRFYSLTVLFR